MILEDDTDPKTKRQKLRVLDKLSIPELKDYKQQLQEEIARVDADISKKEKHQAAVSALFKN